MITWIQALMTGAAVKMILTPPSGAVSWRVLRRTSDTFTGPDDAGAIRVHDGKDNMVLDTQGLVNGVEYHYRAWWHDGTAWHDGGAATETPAYSLRDLTPDILILLRDRLAAGLAAELALGHVHHPNGKIAVLTSPPQKESAVPPVVTLQLTTEASADRVIGEDLLGFIPDDPDYLDYGETEGWFESVRIDLMVWSLNPEERNTLRRIVRRLVQGNLPVLAEVGAFNVGFAQSDTEDFETYGAPMYQSIGTLTCTVPSIVLGGDANVIRDVPVTARAI